MCQLEMITKMGKESFYINFKKRLLSSLKSKLKKILKNIIRTLELGLSNSLKRLITIIEEGKKDSEVKPLKDSFRRFSIGLKPGDIVKIRSKEDILKTLDEKGRLDGCALMKEMWQYCNSEQEVLKRVNYFFDERHSKFLKAHNTVILKGLQCSGNISGFPPKCDRLCYFFWREEWLKKIKDRNNP